MAARISLRVKSGCLATRAKSHSECSSSGEVLPPLGLASTLPVSLRRRHHRITELTPTSNTSATSRRDAPLSTASTARSRKSVEYGFGIDLAPRRINFSRFARAKAVGNPPDSMPPGNALVTAGNCEMEGVMLELIPDGWADFGANVSSGGNDDSWGILSFHFHQANGLVVWNSGSFWSPTIGVGNTTPWTFQFQYPAVLFDTIATIDFTNHC